MNDKLEPKTLSPDIAWLEKDDPEIYHLLRGLEQDVDALRWLNRKGEGLYLFAKALDGDKPRSTRCRRAAVRIGRPV